MEERPDPLANLDIYTIPYKNVAGHDILADIMFPKGLKPGVHPVLVNWHGGGLVLGSRSFSQFFPGWIESFARRHSAIVVSADYRLLPENKIADIHEDVAAFGDWLYSSLPKALENVAGGEHKADLSRVIITGASSGAWCATQMAIDRPNNLRALMIQYPQVGLDNNKVGADDPGDEELNVFGMPIMTKQQLNEHLKTLKHGTPISEGGFERVPLSFSAIFRGTQAQWLAGVDSPAMQIANGAKLPPKVWLIHGENDSVVPVACSKEFATLLEKHNPDTQVKVEYFPGDHGFDNYIDATKLQSGFDWVAQGW